MSSRSHHFHGIGQYPEQIMDLAEGELAFTGRGKKPSNKTVLAEIASINKQVQARAFFSFQWIQAAMLMWLAYQSCR